MNKEDFHRANEDTMSGNHITSATDATHLVVFQHGLLGSDNDFRNFVALFEKYFPAEHLYPYVTECNATHFSSLFLTYDGIETGGTRLADEIIAVASTLPHLKKFSVIGHSLGGLYARFAIGELFARNFFDNIEPMNFISLATPHLGIRRPRRGVYNALYNAVAPKLFSRTGQQFTLTDVAADETIALSQVDHKYSADRYNMNCDRISGSLLVRLPRDPTSQAHDVTDFELYDCQIHNRCLQVYPHSSAENEPVLEVELYLAQVTLVIPEIPETATTITSGLCWDIEIRYNTKSLVVLRFAHDELPSQWNWISVISSSSFGILCSSESSFSTESASVNPPSTLSCLARGQFLQALQMFQVRTAYANVFSDLQVPYSCGSIRAYNPYRMDGYHYTTSPFYPHITVRSLWNAPFLRDTLPEHPDHKHRKHSVKNILVKSLSLSRKRSSSHNLKSGTSVRSQSPSKSRLEALSMTALDVPERHSWSGITHKHLATGRLLDRLPPFVQGNVLLDQVQLAYRSDDVERDRLRSMLVSLQCLGWRRIDVLFGSVMAHEQILAKRANMKKPLNGGLDIVHHVMDTFVL